MKPYWIKFTDGSSGCCEGRSLNDAMEIAEHVSKKQVMKIESLPFAALPTIWQFDHPVHGTRPLRCHTPHACSGLHVCPRVPRCKP